MAKWTDGWLRPRDYNLYVFISIQTDAFVYSLLVTVDLMQYTPKFIARLNWAPKNGNANTSCAYARVIRENFYWKYISNKKLNIEIILSIPNMHNEKKKLRRTKQVQNLCYIFAHFLNLKFAVVCTYICIRIFILMRSIIDARNVNFYSNCSQYDLKKSTFISLTWS